MKMLLLTVMTALVATSCDESTEIKQSKKSVVDKLLSGEQVPIHQLKFEKDGKDRILTPEELAIEIGYSEKDLKRLRCSIVQIPPLPTPEAEK